MDNFDDFSPSVKGPSKLASLFGLSRSSVPENPSLTYTPPRQPRDESPQKTKQPSTSGVKLEVLLAKTVQAYKLIGGNYRALGKTGLTIVGSKTPPLFQFLLYKTKEELICKIRILQNFVFTVLDNNYASFYAEGSQNFSIMFENGDDLRQFARQLLICKAYSEEVTDTIKQELRYGISSSSVDFSTVDVKYCCFKLEELDTPGPFYEEQTTWTKSERPNWSLGIEFREDGESAVILPANMSHPWTDIVSGNSKLLVEVRRIISTPLAPSPPVNDGVDSALESSNEESIVKERGAVLKEALSGRSPKSSLISRMARMGQATLPLRGAIAANPSDSEEESSPSPKPRTRLKPSTENFLPHREPAVRWTQPAAPPLTQSILPSTSQPLALYQHPMQSQILMQRSDLTPFGSLVSTATSALPSPSEASLSAHFTESRTQAAELRMGLGKVSDKVDLVLNKIQDLREVKQCVPTGCTVDPAGILSSIQALLGENETLRSKVENQRQKIDDQNERIYQLLDFSQKTIEKQSISSQQPSPNELKLTADLNTSQESEKVLRGEIEQHVKTIATIEKKLQEYDEREKKSGEELNVIKAEKQTLMDEISDIKTEKKKLEDENRQLKENIEEFKNKLFETERILRDAKETLSETTEDNSDVTKIKDQLDVYSTKCKEQGVIIKNLEADLSEVERMKALSEASLELKKLELEKLEAQLTDLEISSKSMQKNDLGIDGIKSLMNLLYRTLLTEFNPAQSYVGSDIKQALASTIRDMTLKFIDDGIATKTEVIEKTSEPNQPQTTNFDPEEATEILTPDIAQNSEQTDIATPSKSIEVSNATSPGGSTSEISLSRNDSITSKTSPKHSKEGEQGINETESEIHTAVKEVEWKEDDFQPWRSSQPPPPPLFDEDDEDY